MIVFLDTNVVIYYVEDTPGFGPRTVRHLTNFRARLVPSTIFWLLGILSALLAVGVIVPMFFLTARDDSSRCLLLIGFIVLTVALVTFFAIEIRRLRRADRLAPDTF